MAFLVRATILRGGDHSFADTHGRFWRMRKVFWTIALLCATLAVPVMMHAGAGANGGMGTVPDIDFTSAMAAVGVFSGAVLVIRGLRKK
jgi:hypothetical protein